MADRIMLNETSYHGSGAIKEIANEAKARAFKKAFVCSDPDLIRFGVTAKVTDVLEQAGLAYEIYSDIKANPTIENVQHGVEAFKAAGADYIVAIGGGSSMDTAKAIGIIIANPEFEDVRSLEGTAPTKKPCVPIIAVPTTAGTAAEVTINYVITDVERKRKFVCVDPHDMPVVAVVDPDMMASMPKGLTASTGMDALTHAIEGYTTKAAWEMTDMLHLKAIEIISRSLRGAVAGTKEGRDGMALGQYIAGMGFSNVGLGIAHSMAHTLGAVYDTPHGVACAMMLPIVMEYNAECTGEKYREIARAMGVAGVDAMSQEEYRKAAVEAVRKLSQDVGIPAKLEALKEEDLQFLAESAYADACCPGNPKDTSVEDLKEELASLRTFVQENASCGTGFRWAAAVVGRDDLIFPAANQFRAWEGTGVRVVGTDCAHYDRDLFGSLLCCPGHFPVIPDSNSDVFQDSLSEVIPESTSEVVPSSLFDVIPSVAEGSESPRP